MFEHMANQEKKAALARRLPEPKPDSTAEARLNAGGPAFVAVRYDNNHVVFMVDQTKLSFGRHSERPRPIAAPQKAVAQLAGLEQLWGPTAEAMDHLPEIMKSIPNGE